MPIPFHSSPAIIMCVCVCGSLMLTLFVSPRNVCDHKSPKQVPKSQQQNTQFTGAPNKPCGFIYALLVVNGNTHLCQGSPFVRTQVRIQLIDAQLVAGVHLICAENRRKHWQVRKKAVDFGGKLHLLST